MTIWSQSLIALTFGVLASACAQVQRPAATSPRAANSEKVFVTGSHIPLRVESRPGTLPTISPVRTYQRDEIANTGLQSNTGAALRELDPSVSLGR